MVTTLIRGRSLARVKMPAEAIPSSDWCNGIGSSISRALWSPAWSSMQDREMHGQKSQLSHMPTLFPAGAMSCIFSYYLRQAPCFLASAGAISKDWGAGQANRWRP